MDTTFKKIDECFDEQHLDPASSDELKLMQRTFPNPLPSTHVFDYRWEERATPAKPRILPRLIIGPRELSLAEVADRTKNFETLGIAELRWLVDRHKVQMLPAVKGARPKGDVEAMREALVAHHKDTPKESPRKPVTASKPADGGAGPGAVVLPPEIAAADDPTLKKIAATKGLLEEFERAGGKNIAQKRAWLAGKIAAQKPQPVEAVETAA